MSEVCCWALLGRCHLAGMLTGPGVVGEPRAGSHLVGVVCKLRSLSRSSEGTKAMGGSLTAAGR